MGHVPTKVMVMPMLMMVAVDGYPNGCILRGSMWHVEPRTLLWWSKPLHLQGSHPLGPGRAEGFSSANARFASVGRALGLVFIA